MALLTMLQLLGRIARLAKEQPRVAALAAAGALVVFPMLPLVLAFAVFAAPVLVPALIFMLVRGALARCTEAVHCCRVRANGLCSTRCPLPTAAEHVLRHSGHTPHNRAAHVAQAG